MLEGGGNSKLCFHSFVGLLLHLLSAHLWCSRMQIASGYGFLSKKSGEPSFHLLVLRITIHTWPRFETSTVTRFWSFTKQMGISLFFQGVYSVIKPPMGNCLLWLLEIIIHDYPTVILYQPIHFLFIPYYNLLQLWPFTSYQY